MGGRGTEDIVVGRGSRETRAKMWRTVWQVASSWQEVFIKSVVVSCVPVVSQSSGADRHTHRDWCQCED